MQCPNCHKEALNVNGRYVCLDCGIEISTTGAPNSYAAPPPPPVENHASQSIAPTQDATPQYPQGATPVAPVQPAGVDVEFTPARQPEVVVQPAEQPPTQRPVKDYYLDALNKMANGTTDYSQAEASVPAPESVVNTVSSVPAQTSSQDAPSAVVADFPQVPSATAEPPIITPQPVAMPPSPTVNQTPSPVGNYPIVDAPPEVPSLNEPVSTAPTEPVQPSYGGVTVEPPPPVQELPAEPIQMQDSSHGGERVIQPPQGGNPLVSNFTMPTQEELNTPVTAPVGGFDGIGTSFAETSPTPQVAQPATQEQGGLPGVSNIPSAESVFGAAAGPTQPEIMPEKGAGAKKAILIVVAVVIGIAIISLIAWAAIFFLKSGSNGNSGTVDSGKVLEISQAVAGIMDTKVGVETKFTEKLDFSQVTPLAAPDDTKKTENLQLFFSENIDRSGTWVIDGEGDSSLDLKEGTLNDVRRYLKRENNTYTFSASTNTWVKTSGMLLNGIPFFVPLESPGSLFYTSRVENFSSLGQEKKDGNNYQKIKIVPKDEIIIEYLIAQNPELLEDIKIESLNTEKISIVAMLDSSNQIVSVVFTGSVDIKSDLFEGTINFNCSGDYVYRDSNITAP